MSTINSLSAPSCSMWAFWSDMSIFSHHIMCHMRVRLGGSDKYKTLHIYELIDPHRSLQSVIHFAICPRAPSRIASQIQSRRLQSDHFMLNFSRTDSSAKDRSVLAHHAVLLCIAMLSTGRSKFSLLLMCNITDITRYGYLLLASYRINHRRPLPVPMNKGTEK